MKILGHISTLAVQNQMRITSKAISRSIQRLSSGSRVNAAQDDSASLSISSKLEAQTRGLRAANQNINAAQGMLETASGAISTQMEIVQRLRELSVQAANGTLTSSDRDNLNTEFQGLLSEFNRITAATEFNGIKLLDGSLATSSIYVGDGRGAKGDNIIDFSIPSSAATSIFKSTVGTGTFTSSQTLDTWDTFSADVSYSSGASDAKLADFNEDGNLDMVTADSTSSTISIRLGAGDGSFGVAATYQATQAPTKVVTGDFNNDNHQDVAVSYSGYTTVSVFMGDGAGGLGTKADFDGSDSVDKLVVADFDNDGHDDLALLEIGISAIEVFLADGAGVFTTPSDTLGTSSSVTDIAIGDWSNDGNLDIFTADSYDQTISLFAGTGSGTFGARGTVAVNYNYDSLAVGDLTGDGLVDIALGSSIDFMIGTYRHDGNRTDVFADDRPIQVAITDYNQDTMNDVIAITSAGILDAFYGNGLGQLDPATHLDIGASGTSLTLGDIDNDTWDDFVYSDPGSDMIGVYGSSFGPMAFSSTYIEPAVFTQGQWPYGVKVGDLNGDGINDIVSSNYFGGTVSVFLGNANGTYQNQMTYDVGTSPESLVLADFNGDGKLDMAVSSYTESAISVLTNKGNGIFNNRTTVSSLAFGDLQAGDVDGNGTTDLINVGWAGPIYTHLNNGTGSFGSQVSTAIGDSPRGSAMADINGDNKLDLIVAELYSNALRVFLGNGNGSFTAGATLTTGSNPVNPVLADFNNDGKLDVAVADSGTTTISIFLGAGNGTFGARSTVASSAGGINLIAGDINGDGNVDLVEGFSSGSFIATFLGTGMGTFATRKTIGISTTYDTYPGRSMALNDMNRDGVVDIVTANGTRTLSVLLNGTTTQASTTAEMNISSQSNAQAVLSILDIAFNNLRTSQASLGALHERLDFAASANMLMSDNISEARSKMIETDVALETAELVRNQILQQAQVAILAQANIQLKLVIDLLRFN